MNLRGRRKKSTGTGVLLSPLIDCVFLLLIFFLVTSMIKRFERQIPVTLADDTSAITTDPRDDSYPLGVSQDGQIYGPAGQNRYGVKNFEPLADPDAFLKALLVERGAISPVTILVERGTTFQFVIRVQDRLELIGFENIRFRIRDFPLGADRGTTRS